MARFRHHQTINLEVSAPSGSLLPLLAPQASNSPKLRRLGTSRHHRRSAILYDDRGTEYADAIKTKVPLRGESESTMSSYFSAIAVFLLVLSPLFVPVAVTVLPLASSGVRRMARAFGLNRPAPSLA
jgi:hypothetical protein